MSELKTSFSGNLARVIGSAVKKTRSFSALENGIRERSHSVAVSRKQLKSIAKGETARLSMDQFDALDAYLRATSSKSLVALLGEYDDRLLSEVARASALTFILGERPSFVREGLSLSKWDFESMAGFLRKLYSVSGSSNLRIDFTEAGLLVGSAVVTPETFADDFGSQTWFTSLSEDHNPIISLGSPRSCHASEVMLADMFGIDPFLPEAPPDLPFYFGWPSNDHFRHGCSFFKPREPFPKETREQEPPWTNRSVVVGGREYLMRREGDHWISYGISAVQRLSDSTKIRAVFCGLSGPETRGAARLADHLDLPPLPATGPSSVAWALSETTLRLIDPGERMSPRAFVSSRIVQSGVADPR